MLRSGRDLTGSRPCRARDSNGLLPDQHYRTSQTHRDPRPQGPNAGCQDPRSLRAREGDAEGSSRAPGFRLFTDCPSAEGSTSLTTTAHAERSRSIERPASSSLDTRPLSFDFAQDEDVSPPPPYTAAGRLARRLQAIDHVLAHPGLYAARYKRESYRRENTGAPTRLTLKSSTDLFYDHIHAMLNIPAYWHTREGRAILTAFFDTG